MSETKRKVESVSAVEAAQDSSSVATASQAETSLALSSQPSASRRRFLTGAGVVAAGGAATLAMPNVARAQGQRWRMQSGWPAGDMFHEFAQDLVNKINEMAEGELEIELLPAGAVVGALELQDAIVGGILDGSHGVSAYWYGKNRAASLFGTPPSFGWTADEFLGWMKYGGGQELYDELVQEVLGLDIVGFLTGPMPTQALGWFQEPIRDVSQFNGLRYRTVGLAADLFAEFGTAVTILGAPDIVPSLDRGVIDGAEFNNPSSDRFLGFQDVSKTWMLQSYHQDCEGFEVNFNKTKFEALSPALQAIIRNACEAASADMHWKSMARYPEDQRRLVEEDGVNLYITPDSVLEAQLNAWDTVIENNSADNEFFGKVIDSQRTWARDVVGYRLNNDTPKAPAYRHFFGEPPLSAEKL